MAACLAEDDLLALARGRRALGDDATLEAHVAGCASCAGLLAQLVQDEAPAWGELVGRQLGRYRLEAQIGAGGMGAVYRAHDERLGRPVAVKILPRRLAGDAHRLETEARAAAAINHRNVVTVHDVGRDGELPFVVSELVEGESLRSRLDRGKLPRGEVVDLARQLAEGLAAAHARGVIHRDLKPENLIVARDGTLKILDFGLAKLATLPGEHTEPGAVLGTLGYLSPEQARGEPADARSDLFAAGAVIHELASGKRAFAGASPGERLGAVLRDTPPDVDDPALAPVVRRLLEKDPERRFHSAADLAWTLSAPVAPPAKPSRRRFLAGMAGGAAAGAAAMWLGRPRSRRPRVDFAPLTFRHGRVWGARFTPDGASLVHAAAWDEAPLAVATIRLDGGGTRMLPLPPADVLAVSAHGELALALGPRIVIGFHTAGRLAVVPLEGGEPRVLADGVQQADFGPDGELAVVRAGESDFALEWPLGRPVFRAGWLSSPRVSPDGKQVAVLAHPSPFDDRGEVMLVDRAGRQRRLAGPYSSAAGLAWERDKLWVGAAVRGAGNAVRALGPDGRERDVVQTTGRLRLLDAAGDRLAVSHDVWRMRLMVHAAGAGNDVDRSLSDVSMVTAMTPDGQTLAFAELGDATQQAGVYLRATAGGDPLHLGPGAPLAISPDGTRVIALRMEPMVLVEYSTRRGEARPLPLAPLEMATWAAYAGDDLLLAGAAAGRPPRLWRLRGEEMKPLSDEGVPGPAACDGTRVAAVAGNRCLVWPLAGGAPTEVAGDFAGQSVVAWHTDGASLLVRDNGWPISLRRVEIASGAASILARIEPPVLGRKGLDTFVASASGEAYAYSYGHELGQLFLVRRG